jgi:hypothetical protein
MIVYRCCRDSRYTTLFGPNETHLNVLQVTDAELKLIVNGLSCAQEKTAAAKEKIVNHFSHLALGD